MTDNTELTTQERIWKIARMYHSEEEGVELINAYLDVIGNLDEFYEEICDLIYSTRGIDVNTGEELDISNLEAILEEKAEDCLTTAESKIPRYCSPTGYEEIDLVDIFERSQRY